MSKMILNITATLFSALMLWNCVEDESTVGESTVNNDNTYSPLTVKAAMTTSSRRLSVISMKALIRQPEWLTTDLQVKQPLPQVPQEWAL